MSTLRPVQTSVARIRAAQQRQLQEAAAALRFDAVEGKQEVSQEATASSPFGAVEDKKEVFEGTPEQAPAATPHESFLTMADLTRLAPNDVVGREGENQEGASTLEPSPDAPPSKTEMPDLVALLVEQAESIRLATLEKECEAQAPAAPAADSEPGAAMGAVGEGPHCGISAPFTHAPLEKTSPLADDMPDPAVETDADSEPGADFEPDAKAQPSPKGRRRRVKEIEISTLKLSEHFSEALHEHGQAVLGSTADDREATMEECPTVRMLQAPFPRIPPVPLPMAVPTPPAGEPSPSASLSCSPTSQHSAKLHMGKGLNLSRSRSGSECLSRLELLIDLRAGDIVALGAGAPPEYRGMDAIVTKVAEAHCTVVALDGELKFGAGECWPCFQDVTFKSSLGRLGTRVAIQGLTGARTKGYNGREGTIVAHHREGHPCFIRKPSAPDTPVLVLNVELDKEEKPASPRRTSGRPEQVLLEMRFLAALGGSDDEGSKSELPEPGASPGN